MTTTETTYAKYAWIIDRDYLADPRIEPGKDVSDDSDVGRVGPRNADPRLVSRLHHPQKTGARFKIYDDDGELYYAGRLVLLDADEETLVVAKVEGFRIPIVTKGLGEYGYGPLNDFGDPNAGATEIRYKDGRNQWGSL